MGKFLEVNLLKFLQVNNWKGKSNENQSRYLLRLAIINPPARKQEIFWLRLIAIKIVFRLILIATRLKLNANGLAIINLDSH
jgi:hypothetical protein